MVQSPSVEPAPVPLDQLHTVEAAPERLYGQFVAYHGSVIEQHGIYLVGERACDDDNCWNAATFRISLGLPKPMRDYLARADARLVLLSHRTLEPVLEHVRPESVTVLDDRDMIDGLRADRRSFVQSVNG